MSLFDGSSHQAVTLDLSASGARLLSPVSAIVGSRARLKIGSGSQALADAKVLGARSVADRYELRVCFHPLTPSVMERLLREVRAAERAMLRERADAEVPEIHVVEAFVEPEASGDDRRRSRRIRLEMNGKIRVGTAFVNAKILDISSGGAKVRLAQVMRVGEGVTLPIPGLGVEVRGVVRSVRVRAKDLHFEIGVKFEFADAAQARTVRAGIAQLRRRAEAASPTG